MLALLRFLALTGLLGLLMVPMVSAQEADPPKASPADLAKLFQRLDENGDGKLTSEEFQKIAELPQFKNRLGGVPRGLPENFDLEKLKERLGPERFEKLKERFGGKIDAEKIKEFLEKRKNRNP